MPEYSAAGRTLGRACSSAFDRATRQGAELDRVENMDLLALGGDQLVLLETGEYPGHGFHRQAQVVADFVARHAQAELVGRKTAGTEACREVDREQIGRANV